MSGDRSSRRSEADPRLDATIPDATIPDGISSSSTGTDADVTTPREVGGTLPARLIGSVAFGTILQPVNSSMIAVALVSIRASFHSGSATSWLVSVLYLATAVSAPTSGRLADLIGARRVFFGGLGLIVVASLIAPFSPNIGVLIASRALLGIGTAAQYPAALAMIRRAAERLHARPTSALAALGVCGQATVALGPTLGGLLVGAFGWESIFLVNLPLAALGYGMVRRSIPPDDPRTGDRAVGGGVLRSLDLPGLLLFSASVAVLMVLLLSFADRPQPGWLALLLPLVGVLLWRERQAAVPFLDLRLFTNRGLAEIYARAVLTWAAFYAIFYGLPQWLEEARGIGPSAVGLLVLPIAGVGIGSTLAGSRVVRRNGIRPALVVGSALLLVAGLALLVPGDRTPVWLLFVLAGVLGLPNGFNSQGTQNAVYAAAEPDQVGAAAGLFRTSQYTGANIAAALLAMLFGSGAADSAGLHRLGIAVAVISAMLLVAALASRTFARTRV